MFRYPALLSLFFGVIAALGFAPLQLWPLTLVGLAGWLLLVHAAPGWRAAAWRGWLFGLSHFTVNDNWIGHAFDFQDTMPHALGYLAPPALALYLALFPMGAALIAWRFRGRRADASYALIAGAAWIATDWLRGWLFTGYPWDPIAAIWVDAPVVPKAAALVGTYALSGLTVTGAAMLLLLIDARRRGLSRARLIGGTLIACLALSIVEVALHILDPAPVGLSTKTPRLVVVQPNIGNAERDDAAGERSLRALIRGSGRPEQAPRLVVWPEGLVVDLLEDGYPDMWYQRPPDHVRARIAAVLGPRDRLLTNAPTLAFGPKGAITGAGNSVLAVDPKARIVGRYDKAHLVPYGEYVPIPWLLQPLGLARLVPGGIDFDPGPGPRNIEVPGIGLVGIQVCYEIVFSGRVVDPAHRPRLLFNPSNDAWFGSWGPPQHQAQARLRAIEEGLPIVRATPTGISAVIAADGTVLASLPLGTAGTLSVPLPQPLPPTPFARLGNWLALIVAGLLAAGGVAIRWRAR